MEDVNLLTEILGTLLNETITRVIIDQYQISIVTDPCELTVLDGLIFTKDGIEVFLAADYAVRESGAYEVLSEILGAEVKRVEAAAYGIKMELSTGAMIAIPLESGQESVEIGIRGTKQGIYIF